MRYGWHLALLLALLGIGFGARSVAHSAASGAGNSGQVQTDDYGPIPPGGH